MGVKYKVDNNVIRYTGYGILVCYDVPTLGVKHGHGVIPTVHFRIIKKLEAAGKVARLQHSVILVEDPAALPLVIDVLERVNARYLVVEGRITGTHGVIGSE